MVREPEMNFNCSLSLTLARDFFSIAEISGFF